MFVFRSRYDFFSLSVYRTFALVSYLFEAGLAPAQWLCIHRMTSVMSKKSPADTTIPWEIADAELINS